jgi:hypothetical protein
LPQYNQISHCIDRLDDPLMSTHRQRKGGYPVPPGASDILGVEFSGTIEELGSEVSGFTVGQEVIGLVYGVSPIRLVVLLSCPQVEA